MSPQRGAPPVAPATLKATLVAPCGIDCGLCIQFQRRKDRCPGCARLDGSGRSSCTRCALRRCGERTGRFCSACAEFPCARLRRLDRRYRTRYRTSPLENLATIDAGGVRAFLRAQRARWSCSRCGSLLCVHQASCASCGTSWREADGPDALRR